MVGVLSSCVAEEETAAESSSDVPTADSEAAESINTSQPKPVDTDGMFTERDSKTEYDKSNCVSITLNGDSISCSSKAVTINGNVASITDEGTYIIAGTLNDGMIVVNADDTDKLQIVLDGASITSSTSAPIYVAKAKKVFITLADNSNNVLANGGSFVAIDDSNIDAVVFSTENITFNGNGSLSIDSPTGHGISSKDDLVIAGGTYQINSTLRALDANDSVRIKDSTLALNSQKDAIHAENAEDVEKGFVYIRSGTVKIDSKGDGISASSYVQIDDGTFEIVTSNKDKTVSIRSIKASTNVYLGGGDFTLQSGDDVIKAKDSVTIAGGTFVMKADDDAINANAVFISDGEVSIPECYEGIDSKKIEISDGIISIVAAKDAIKAHADSQEEQSEKAEMTVRGGFLNIQSDDDGIDIDGTLTVLDGTIVLFASKLSGSQTLSCTETVVAKGGTIACFDWNSLTVTFSDDSIAMVKLSLDAERPAEMNVSCSNNSNIKIFEQKAERSFRKLRIYSGKVSKGEVCTVALGDSLMTTAAK